MPYGGSSPDVSGTTRRTTAMAQARKIRQHWVVFPRAEHPRCVRSGDDQVSPSRCADDGSFEHLSMVRLKITPMTSPDPSPRASTLDLPTPMPATSPSTRFALIALTAIVMALTVLGSVVWWTVQHNRRPAAANPKATITSQTRDRSQRASEPMSIPRADRGVHEVPSSPRRS